jgi:hypothetical protein
VTYVPKPQRIVNRKLLDSYQGQPCAVLGPKSDVGGRESAYHWGPVAGHHLKHVATGGNDVDENLCELCQWHHSLIHSGGVRKFLDSWIIEPKALAKITAYLESRGK